MLGYFHGALPDEDADKLLVREGDFLVQTRHDRNLPRTRLLLTVRKAQLVRRFELRRLAGNGLIFMVILFSRSCQKSLVCFQSKTFPDLKTLIEHHQSRVIDAGNGDLIILKRGIQRGRFQLTHKDIRLLRKVNYIFTLFLYITIHFIILFTRLDWVRRLWNRLQGFICAYRLDAGCREANSLRWRNRRCISRDDEGGARYATRKTRFDIRLLCI